MRALVQMPLFFTKRSSSFFDDGVNDVWVSEANSGGTLTPEINQGGLDEEFVTRLNDITRSSQSVLWGGVASAAIETDRLNLGSILFRPERRLTLLFRRSILAVAIIGWHQAYIKRIQM